MAKGDVMWETASDGAKFPSDNLISKELFELFHEGFMIGHSYGPGKEYRVEIRFRSLEKSQRFHDLLYDLFNPTPLECPMCGAPKAFAVYPYDHSTGYCSTEDRSWSIRPGKALVAAAEPGVGMDGVPWCEPCESYHVRPETVEHWRELGCKEDRPDLSATTRATNAPQQVADELASIIKWMRDNESVTVMQIMEVLRNREGVNRI